MFDKTSYEIPIWFLLWYILCANFIFVDSFITESSFLVIACLFGFSIPFEWFLVNYQLLIKLLNLPNLTINMPNPLVKNSSHALFFLILKCFFFTLTRHLLLLFLAKPEREFCIRLFKELIFSYVESLNLFSIY